MSEDWQAQKGQSTKDNIQIKWNQSRTPVGQGIKIVKAESASERVDEIEGHQQAH